MSIGGDESFYGDGDDIREIDLGSISTHIEQINGLINKMIKAEKQYIYTRKSRAHYRKLDSDRLKNRKFWKSTDAKQYFPKCPPRKIKGIECEISLMVSFNLHEYCCSVDLTVKEYSCSIFQPMAPNISIKFYADSLKLLFHKMYNDVSVVNGVLIKNAQIDLSHTFCIVMPSIFTPKL